jgi:hypothetical protein
MAAAKRANLKQGMNQWSSQSDGSAGISQGDAAQLYGVKVRNVQRARAVLNHGNQIIIDAVSAGKLRLPTASAIVKKINNGEGFPINSVADLHRTAKQLWRERLDAKRLTPIDLCKYIARFASKKPIDIIIDENDEWAKLTILEDLNPVLGYLKDLQSALQAATTNAREHGSRPNPSSHHVSAA